jgi:lysophospholipase L1-like esterase
MSIRWLRALSMALLSLICIAPNAVHAAHRALMIGLGDSISAAALADTSTQNSWPFPWGLPIPNIDNPLDGIGFNSDFENKRTFSWVSGLMIDSHYLRLREYLKPSGEKLWSLNFSVTGSVSQKLFDQVKEVDMALKSGLFNSLPYVTLLVGANDLCKSVPIEEFHQNIHNIFGELAKLGSPDGRPIRILVSSIPRIPDLGRDDILNYHTAIGYSCRDARSLPFSYCTKMTRWKNEAERQHLIAMVDEVNEILRTETEEAGRRYRNIDAYFSPVLSQSKLDPTHLAMDCFHPNAQGQAEIAHSLWHDQPWFH